MKHLHHVVAALLLVPLAPLPAAPPPPPVKLIFDTDMGNDVDDLMALIMIHNLQRRGACELLGVTITKDHPQAAAFVDAVNTLYGYPDTPIGVVRDGPAKEAGKFNRLADENNADGSPRYPHDLKNGADAPEAVGLIRKLLAAQPDGSVTLAQVGFFTNLSRLLDSPADAHSPLGGRELIAKKVKLLSVMAGAFQTVEWNTRHLEYNVQLDVPAARKLAQNWPTPVVWSGFEIGVAAAFPHVVIERDLEYLPHHPLKDAYYLYQPPPHDRPTWDPTAVLYAVLPDRGYFDLSPAGNVAVEDDAATLFRPTPNGSGRHRFLVMNPAQTARVREAIVQFCVAPPRLVEISKSLKDRPRAVSFPAATTQTQKQHMKIRTRSAMMVTAMMATAAVSAASEWPQWRGPNYDGISKETTWDPAAVNAKKVAWEAQVGAGYSAVAVANGKVYTAGNFNKDTDAVLCFDAASGKQLWRHDYPEPLAPKYYSGGSSATPTVAGGKVYFASKSGKVFCLNADTGKVVWKKEFGLKVPTWGFSSSALIQGKAAIFNVGKSGVAYDKETGAVLWTSADDACGYATPVPFEQNGKKCLALFAKDTLTAVAADTGKVLWTYPWQTQHDVNASDPIISGSQVFITSGYGRGGSLIDFSGAEPKKVWENKNMRSQISGPVLIGGYIYGFDDNRLTCLDWKTGEEKWNEKSPKKGSLMAAGDKLIVIGESGRLAIAEATPTAYKELAAAQVVSGRCWTMPILADGRIYVRDSDGHLVCLDVRK